MNDLASQTLLNEQATEREREQLRRRIFELEVILDIPHADTTIDTWYFLRRRLRNLKAQVVPDPADNDPSPLPIILGDWQAAHNK